jgi:hypothetical protein
MATQSPTPRGFQRPLWSVAAIGLTALLWSCESEQTGYEVSIPLIGPIEFDGNACEISGDECTSDTDCVDDEGAFVGPCTKAMDPLEPITVPVSLSPANPSYTLGIADTSGWASIFASQQYGGVEGAITMNMDGFSISGGPVTIEVDIFSRVGLVGGQPRGYQPVTPASCRFTLDDTSVGQDYADGVNTCLSDWISQNGTPIDFDMTVTSSAGGSSAALAAKSGFATKQAGYTVDGEWTMATDSQCDFEYSADILEAIQEGEDFFAALACDGLTLSGSLKIKQELTLHSAIGFVWDRCGNASAANLTATMLAGPPAGVEEAEYTISEEEGADIPVQFFPSGVDFTAALIGAATGECLSGTVEFADAIAVAGWNHCGAEPPPARQGSIQLSSNGFCSVAEGSDGAEDTVQ